MDDDKAYAWLVAKAKAAGVMLVLLAMTLGVAVALLEPDSARAATDDVKIVADLDMRYQAAVKRNDAAAMARILHDDFVLVTGTGASYTKSDLLKWAREQTYVYELQDEEPGTQVVRLYGDTAIVTAKLILKATTGGKLVQKTLWFSDAYVRTADGWKYAFGQASLALPES
jgi:ketosteroid isomerase-like protein